MRSQGVKPIIHKDELFLSGPVLIEILCSILDKGVPFRFCARGFSMHPFVRDGDLVTISPLQGDLPHSGDTIAFAHPKTERLAIHRVVKRKGDCFLVKGDGLTRADGFINISNVFGYVSKVERNGKSVRLGLGLERFLLALLTRMGNIYTLLLPFWKFVRIFIRKRHERFYCFINYNA